MEENSSLSSDVVSDVNSEEMAKLMMDIDDIDTKLLNGQKSNADEVNQNIQDKTLAEDKRKHRRVSFGGSTEKKIDNDWDDVGNLLISDDETKHVNEKKNDVSIKSENISSSPSKSSSSNQRKSPFQAKSNLMADLFTDSSDVNPKSKSSDSKAGHSSQKTNMVSDDLNDLLVEDNSKKSKEPDYLDTLLSANPKSSASKQKEFVLPDKYTDSSKVNSPEHKNKPSDTTPFEDFFSDSNSRSRRSTKPDFNFDDLFTDSRSARTSRRGSQYTKEELLNNDSMGTHDKEDNNSNKLRKKSMERSSIQDDWLDRVLESSAKSSSHLQRDSHSQPKAAKLNTEHVQKHSTVQTDKPRFGQTNEADRKNSQHLHNQRNMDQFPPAGNNVYVGPTFAGMSQIEENEEIKQLKIELHTAEISVGKLEAELSILKDQHLKEMEMKEESFKKINELERDVWERKEELLINEREKLVKDFDLKLEQLQKERELLVSTYENRLLSCRSEKDDALTNHKRHCDEMMEQIKNENQQALDRLTQIKDMELKAALSAGTQTRELNALANQLESSASNISEISSALNQKHHSNLELTNKALELKEKQLKDMEANLGVTRAECESERNRLTVLVNRLQSSLIDRGTEVEKAKWEFSQEKLKVEAERKCLQEEKRHFQLMVDSERNNLARTKEMMLRDQKQLAQMMSDQKLQNYSQNGNFPGDFKVNMQIHQIEEEKRVFASKNEDLERKQQKLKDEESKLEHTRQELEEETMKNQTTKELLDRQNQDLHERIAAVERREREVMEERETLEKRIDDIAQQTRDLHRLRDSIIKVQSKFDEREREDVASYRSPKSLAGMHSPGAQFSFRPPGDGREHQKAAPLEKNYDLVSVIERLKMAREEESRFRQNLQIQQ